MSKTNSHGSNQTVLNPAIQSAGGYTLGEAGRLYNQYQGQPLPSQYVGIDPSRRAGLQNVSQIAGQGGAVVPGVLDEYRKTIGGHYLDPSTNPYLDEIVRRSVSAAGAPVTSGVVGSGRLGSGVYANALADTRAATAANLYGANYQRERDLMAQYLGMAPQVEDLAYSPARQMMDVGSAYEADVAAQQDEALRQYLAPYEFLTRYEDSINANPLAGANRQNVRGESTAIDWGAMIGGILSPSVGGGK